MIRTSQTFSLISFLVLVLAMAMGPAYADNGMTVSLPEPAKSDKGDSKDDSALTTRPKFLTGAARWYPADLKPGKWEWVLLNTGEWLKGTIDAIRDDEMEFDSDKFDKVTLKMKDVVETHSSRVDTFVFTNQRVFVGVGRITKDKVIIQSESGLVTLPRTQFISLAVGDRNELNLWSGNVNAGVSASSGNTDQVTANIQASLKRRGAFLRLDTNYYGNLGKSDGVTNIDNQQLLFEADLFIRDRLFLIPAVFEYYTDTFANIKLRVRPGAGIGYQLARRSTLEWQITGVAQYQRVEYESTFDQSPLSESFAATLASHARWDITDDITFTGNYSVTIPTTQSSKPDQQGIFKLEVDITQYVTLNTTLNWTRIGDPTEQADGSTPEPNDISLSVGLGLDF
jgi:putative salt-induced outer membrane protein YdiY